MMKDVALCTGMSYTGFVDPHHEPRGTIMQRFFDFLDTHQWACWLGMAAGSVIVLAIDNSHFVPF